MPHPTLTLSLSLTLTYEVCRMFLAALQLTNQGNLDLVASGSVDGGDLQLHPHPSPPTVG